MNTRYKLCTAITVLNWIEMPLMVVMLILNQAVLNTNGDGSPAGGDTFITALASLGVIFLTLALIIASVVCSIILLVKNNSNSVNSGLTIAVGVCGIVCPIANLVIGIILCVRLKHEKYEDNQ